MPYDGQGGAVAVVDTGVDGSDPPFRGRVAPGTDIFTGGLGNRISRPSTTRPRRRRAAPARAAGVGATVLANTVDGHGTPVAGIIAQFVPQATIVPIDIFLPFNAGKTLTPLRRAAPPAPPAAPAEPAAPARRRWRHRRAGTTTGASTSLTGTSNALTSSNMLYNGLQYVIQHPFVNDPLRPGRLDRVIAASFAFGTTQTFQTEVDAYKNYPQVVIALKNAYHKFLKEGIAPIAAAGEFRRAPRSRGPDHVLRHDGRHGSSRATTTPTTPRWATRTACRCRRS